MRTNIHFCCIVFSFFLLISEVNAQTLNLTFGQNAFALSDKIVGSGIYSGDYSGNFSTYSAASFTNGDSVNLGMNSGVILSTGNLNVPLSPASQFMNSNLSMPGDILLNQISGPTFDAQTLSFDFVATSDSVEFNFILTSEEYNDLINSGSNDVFAFFISGPGYSNNTNIALIPGTSTPASINTINNGGPYPGASSGPCVNCNYFIDNLNTSTGSNPVQISFDGLTVKMKIKFKVWPCSNYNFRISVADVNDNNIDSAILIEENSFKTFYDLPVYVNGIATDTAYICQGGSVTITMPMAANHAWSTGDTSLTITVTQPGYYEAISFDTIVFAFSPIWILTQPNSIQTPVISSTGTYINSNITPSPGITFQWFLDGILIPGATNANVPIQGNGCYRLTIYEGSCESSSNIVCITNTSVNELSSGNFSIAPHPVIDKSIIKTNFNSDSKTIVKLYDLSGKSVFEKAFEGTNEFILESKNFDGGLYFIEMNNSFNNETIYGKVVILN